VVALDVHKKRERDTGSKKDLAVEKVP